MESNDSIKSSLPHCRCDVLKNPWASHTTTHPEHLTHLVAYIRIDQEPPGKQEQINLINDFCSKNGYQIDSIYEDHGIHPGQGLMNATARLDHVGGLLAVDLDRFVRSKGDRLRDLKPFIHDFFCTTNKHLLTIKEGVNTATAAGQHAAIEFISSVKDFT